VYHEVALAAIKLSSKVIGNDLQGHHVVLRSIDYAKPLIYREGDTWSLLTRITHADDNCGSFTLSSRSSVNHEETVHCFGQFIRQSIAKTTKKFQSYQPILHREILAVNTNIEAESISTRTAYDVIFPRVVNYSEIYRTMKSVTIHPNGLDAYAIIKVPFNLTPGNYTVHPVFTDTLLHVAGFVANLQGGSNDAFICSQVDAAKVIPELIDVKKAFGVYVRNAWLPEENVVIANAYAVTLDSPQKIVAHLKRMHFRKLRLNSLKRLLRGPTEAPPEPRAAATHSSTKPVETQNNGKVAKQVHQVEEEGSSDTSATRVVNIKDIMASVLDISVKDIKDDSDFEALGLDSLTSIEALHVLRNELSEELPQHLFTTHTTVRAVQEFVDSLKHSKKSTSKTVSLAATPRLYSAATLGPPSAYTLDALAPPTPFQKATNTQNLSLFLVHDGSGMVNYYERLSSLNRDVWGVSNPKFSSNEEWSDVQAMAAHYAGLIAATTAGPIIVGGKLFSLGLLIIRALTL
jgi:iterative type I PKS product template protein